MSTMKLPVVTTWEELYRNPGTTIAWVFEVIGSADGLVVITMQEGQHELRMLAYEGAYPSSLVPRDDLSYTFYVGGGYRDGHFSAATKSGGHDSFTLSIEAQNPSAVHYWHGNKKLRLLPEDAYRVTSVDDKGLTVVKGAD